jgi:hypothetical protein
MAHVQSKSGRLIILELENITSRTELKINEHGDPLYESRFHGFTELKTLLTEKLAENTPKHESYVQDQDQYISASDLLSILNQTDRLLMRKKTVSELLKDVLELLSRILKYPQLLVQKFDEEDNSQIVEELITSQSALRSLNGFWFPPIDKSAMTKLFQHNKVRFVYFHHRLLSFMIHKKLIFN